MVIARVLTIAGSDSSGGAGIQADLKTFHAFGVYGASVVTAVVAENTVGVRGVFPVPPAFVTMQMESCLDDIGADAVKTGMLVDGATILAVARSLRAYDARNLVVDPVLNATAGGRLLRKEAVGMLISELLPMAAAVTPNIPEAEVLAGFAIKSRDDLRRAAETIGALGPKLVVIKGGHSLFNPAGFSVDYAWDGKTWSAFKGRLTPGGSGFHGTGCTFSAAMASLLARGVAPLEAVKGAKLYVTKTIASASAIGRGGNSLNHWAGAGDST